MVLTVRNLTVRYGNKAAVRDLNLRLGSGQALGLLGANGAGKSSSIAAILGIVKAEFDEVSILGKSPLTERKTVFESVGVQFQETNFQDRLTVEEACVQWRALYERPLKFAPLLETFGLSEKRNQPVKSLSGGEKQRLAVLLALLPDPKLVFLDELTTGLDTKARRMLWKHLLRLKANGLSIVLTSHDMDEVEALCDQAVILREGRTVARGSVQELIGQSGQTTLEDAYLHYAGEEEWI
mgnify:FL=1